MTALLSKIAALLMSVFAVFHPVHVMPKAGGIGGGGATYFAHVDKNGIVDNVIVASKAFIASGAEGPPSEWVQTSMDNSVSEGYAGIGYIYKRDATTSKDAFVSTTASKDAAYDPSKNSWVEPESVLVATSTK